MNNDISNNIEYFATNTNNEPSFIEKYFKYIVGLYLFIAIIIICYILISNDEPNESFLSKIGGAIFKGLLFPLALYLYAVAQSQGGILARNIPAPQLSELFHNFLHQDQQLIIYHHILNHLLIV